MVELECPRCGARFPGGEGWAKSALSTLIVAPAVQDMATQVRCPRCQHLFAASETRHLRASWPKGSSALLVLVGVAIFAWAVYQVLSG